MTVCSSKKMSKNSSNANGNSPHQETMRYFDFFKKVKRSNPLEPSLGFIGFILVAVFFIGCFFYLDYKTVGLGLQYHGVSWLGLVGASSSATEMIGENGGPGFLEKEGDRCDIFDGKWVWDDGYPLYQSKDCIFLDPGFRCLENGRPDSFYTKWRWQPHHCNLPRFNASLMLEKLRNRRLVFVGDSVGRNQWESLLCMLASSFHDNASIYEVNGNPITKHSGFLTFMFKDYNCTVEYYRSPFLVYQGRAPAGAPEGVKMTLRLDTLDWTSSHWAGADVLVFNSGHWWNYEKTVRGGCYFQEGEEVKMDMTVQTAYQKSIETLFNWIHRKVDENKTQVIFRTYAPIHFRGGDWKTGGSCHLEKLPDLGTVPASLSYRFRTPFDVLSMLSNKSRAMSLKFLNITNMAASRKDAHASIYYLQSGPASLHRQDCSHWCLPGVPDSWNELLYALILKRESIFQAQTSSEESQAPL